MIRRLPWIALTALLAGPAAADSPAFSYLDLAYVRADDGGDTQDSCDSCDGASLRASLALGERMLIQLDANSRDHEDGSIDRFSLGAGMHWPVADGIEVAFTLSAEVLTGAFNGPDETGMDGLGVGGSAGLELRARLSPSLELNAGVRAESLADQGSHLTPSAGARFYFSPRVAAGLRVVRDQFDTRAELGLHINLGD